MNKDETFIKTQLFCVPYGLPDEAWDNYTVEQKDKEGIWRPVRFLVSQVQAYRVVKIGEMFYVRVELKGQNAFTTKLGLKEFDEKMKEAGFNII